MSSSFTHVGKVREDNQDAVRIRDTSDEAMAAAGYLFGIADGMGGYAHGGIASSLALETFFETYYAADGISPLQKIRLGFQNANLRVFQAAHRIGSGKMGTTLTAVSVIGRDLYIGHIGDSRAYLVRNQKTICLTNDHTRVGELVRMKLLSPDKVRSHNQRSVLSRCLGLELFVQPDVCRIPAVAKDTVILCTDGVWSVIQDEEFGELAGTVNNPKDLARTIFELAMARDSDDNISVVIFRIDRLAVNDSRLSTDRAAKVKKWFGKFRR